MSAIQHIAIESVCTDRLDLHEKLLTGELPPRPFWLLVGDSSFRITDENRDTLAIGMLLGFTVKDELGR